jgi:hypothetical protein
MAARQKTKMRPKVLSKGARRGSSRTEIKKEADDQVLPEFLPPAAMGTHMTTQDLGDCFRNLKLRRDWSNFVPANLGSQPALDSAVKALVIGLKARELDDSIAWQNSLQYSALAMRQLRNQLDSTDRSLLTVALLRTFDAMETKPVTGDAHLIGMAAIMRARPPQDNPSPLAQSILYGFAQPMFQIFSSLGEVHPLDGTKYEHEGLGAFPGGKDIITFRLRNITFKLFVGLPQLTLRLRRLYRDRMAGMPVKVTSSLSARAASLLSLRDDGAEDAILRRVSLRRTEDLQLRPILGWCYKYTDFDDVQVAVLYWTTRLTATQLGLVLHQLRDITESRLYQATAVEKHLDERERAIANVLMSWQTIRSYRVHVSSVTSVLLLLWGALRNMAVFRGMSAMFVRSYVLRQAQNHLMDTGAVIDEAFMDLNSAISFPGLQECFKTGS